MRSAPPSEDGLDSATKRGAVMSRIREAAANEGTGETTLALTIGDLPEVRNVLEGMLRSMGDESVNCT